MGLRNEKQAVLNREWLIERAEKSAKKISVDSARPVVKRFFIAHFLAAARVFHAAKHKEKTLYLRHLS